MSGISTLVLALVALIMRPRALGVWGVLVLVIMLYAMGDQFVFWTALNRLIPALRWWRVPPRVWLAAALILPYLAGWGAQLFAENPPDRRAARLGDGRAVRRRDGVRRVQYADALVTA